MHRTRRLTLFFLFKSHHDYSNLVSRVESFGSPKRGGEGEEGPLSRFSSTREFSSRYGEINSASPLIAPYPPRNTASRDSPLNRDPITLAMPSAGRIFTRLKGYRSACIYIHILLLFSSFIFLFLADRLPCHHRFHYLERKEGRKEEQRFPSRVRTMNRITRFDTWYIRMFPLYLPRHSSLPLFCPRVTGPSRIGIAKTPTRPIDNP